MSSKKWVLVFLVTVLVLAALLAGLNLAVDPFGAFGDRLLSWFSYDETNNPRVAKFSYLEQHHDEYDSYILGCSSTSSFPVDAFNEAYDASFYNLIMYGADMRDCEKIAQYLVEHYEVKTLILNVYLDNGLTYDEESDRLTKNLHYKEDPDTSVLSYYTRYLFADPRYALAKLNALRTDTILPQTFDVFDERTGCYDKRVRDAEPIGSEERYLESYPVFADYPHQTLSLPYTEQCMQSVAAIKTLCEEAGVNLTVAAGPVYAEYLKNYEPETVAQFYRSLAQVTPFWDFSSSSVSCEMRYFYDGTHFRNNVGEMICARTVEERKVALAKVEPFQQSDFEAMYRIMGDRPMTIRYLDPPLHEFLPTQKADIEELAQEMGMTAEELQDVVVSLHEFNPMMGHRGCRLAVTYPEIAEMQTNAVIKAALKVSAETGKMITPYIMIPLVGERKELKFVRDIVVRTADALIKEAGVDMKYHVGTMIEIPRAALTADEIAKEADFFSFGTNDLTQMTFGFSRDDAAKFLGSYYDTKIYESDPFQHLDINGVGKLVEMACKLGRQTNPELELGICGEHGGDPSSIAFCHKVGLDYVSCSPFRVPIARLAAAQAAIANR